MLILHKLPLLPRSKQRNHHDRLTCHPIIIIHFFSFFSNLRFAIINNRIMYLDEKYIHGLSYDLFSRIKQNYVIEIQNNYCFWLIAQSFWKYTLLIYFIIYKTTLLPNWHVAGRKPKHGRLCACVSVCVCFVCVKSWWREVLLFFNGEGGEV